MQGRHLRIFASGLVLCLAAGACSSSRDTTQIAADDIDAGELAPTTSIVSDPLRTTSTTVLTAEPAASTTGPAALAALLQQLSLDPALAGQLDGLGLGAVASLIGADPAVLAALGLSPEQIRDLARVVALSPPEVQAALGGATVDPTLLLSLLIGPLDLDALVNGGIASVVQALIASIGDLRFAVDPQVSVDLGTLLEQIDPNGLGPVAADPGNAALLALITSAIISANPLLTLQLLSNPLLDPGLKDLLSRLAELNVSLGDAARAALLNAISQLFPDLVPANAAS